MEPLKKILLRLRNVFTKKDDSVIPTDFSDLAPLDSIDNTSEYLNALDWALKNRRIRNVALCGPYGAGKSSIINSYLKSHADAQQKSLRISMATFIESKTEGSDSSHSVALKPDEIETGILKQLFYKVPHTKIPQSRYRKLHKGGKLIAWRNLVLISIFLLLLGFIFAPDHVINVTNILYETWPFSTLPAKVAIVDFAILFTGVLGSIAWCFYPAFSRMKISSISISAKANVEGDEESKESIFNKNMDEIVYFFEETRYRYLRFVPNTGYRYVTSEETLSAIAYKNSNLLIPDGKSMGTYRFCNENVRFTILDKNKYYNAEPAQYILSIGFRPEDTTSEQMLNCIRNLIDIGIIAKDDASS